MTFQKNSICRLGICAASTLLVICLGLLASPRDAAAHDGENAPGQATEAKQPVIDKTKSVITASAPRNWPPYNTTGPDGQPAGFAIDILNAVAARAGYRVSYRIMPTIKDAYDAGLKGVVDVQPNIGLVPSRQKILNFTPPIQSFAVSILVRTESQKIQGIADLDGRKVAVVKRNIGIRLMKNRPAAKAIVFDDIRPALFELLAGTVDALIYPKPIAMELARQAGVEDRLKIVGLPLREIKRAIAVHPSRPEIYRRLSAAVTTFVGSPEYQTIYVRWFGTPKPFWTVARVSIGAGILIFVILIATLGLHYTTIMRLNRNLEGRIERRTAELQKVQEDLVRNERLATLGELTGTVAHELRNPLGTIVTSFEVIRGKAEAAGLDVQNSMDRIKRNVDRCNGIISDLLDYARVKKLSFEPVNIDAWLTEILDEYEFPEAVSVKYDLNASDHPAEIDREQIRQVIIDLVDNACQAIEEKIRETEGVETGSLTIATRIVSDGVEISVSDTGSGIKPENTERIFEPLFSTKSFGVGLGLPNVRKIVTSHSGKVTAEGRPVDGATLTVWLPLQRVDQQILAA